MAFSPARVIGRLLSSFTSDFSPPTGKEVAIADAFKAILRGAENGDVEYEEGEESLQASLDVKEEVSWTPDDDDDDRSGIVIPVQESVFFDGRPISQNTIRRAIAHYRDMDKGIHSLASMANRFKWIRTERHLNLIREFEKREIVEESRVIDFKCLSALLRERVMEAAEQGLPLSYATVRHMAVLLNRELRLTEDFRASKSWIAKFVRECGLRSRRVTRFVTTKSIRCRQEVEQEATDFVKRVRKEMKKFSLSAFANADQTGINKELASGRTLAPFGSEQVMRVAQSVSSLTHSFSAMPVIYADGRLGEKLFAVFPEKKGVFPQMEHWQAPNLLVLVGKTHIMTKSQVSAFGKECVVRPSSLSLTVLLVDSWVEFAGHTNVLSEVPGDKELRFMTIPLGATALCQPLDAYSFRLFKRYIRRLHDHVAHNHPDFTFARDNVLKIVSQTYRQFCAPVFRPCLAYAWVVAGYVAFVKCSWCGRQQCFSCFVELYHTC